MTGGSRQAHWDVAGKVGSVTAGSMVQEWVFDVTFGEAKSLRLGDVASAGLPRGRLRRARDALDGGPVDKLERHARAVGLGANLGRVLEGHVL